MMTGDPKSSKSRFFLLLVRAGRCLCVDLQSRNPIEQIRHYIRFPSCQNATALAAATLRESTPCVIGIITV